MSDGYDSFKKDQIIAELLLRITALENLLITKNIISDADITEHMQLLSNKIASIIAAPINSLPPPPPESDDLVSNTEMADLLKEFNITSFKVSKGN